MISPSPWMDEPRPKEVKELLNMTQLVRGRFVFRLGQFVLRTSALLLHDIVFQQHYSNLLCPILKNL